MSRAVFNELLIAQVVKRPALWDVKIKDFRNKHKKSILWEEIAQSLKEVDESVTVDEVQARWKNLRDTFRKKLKEEKNTKRSGAGAPSKTAYWPHIEQMTFLRDLMEPRRSISNMDGCEETPVSTPLHVEPLDLPSQACRDGSEEVDNCTTARNPFELIFQGPSVPVQVTTPSHPPPSNPPHSIPSNAVSCPRESEEVSSTPQSRSKRQRKKEMETVDAELNAVRNVIAAHRPMDANGLFLLSLKPYLESTPQEMLTDLKMDLLHICSNYSEGRRPHSLRACDY
ncbi:uncharacterized protein LOC119389997 [Rhipicephalus sanguineus]|nr:uncharacterized protein LOC119389997 [Rhipicephalus sanguineus]